MKRKNLHYGRRVALKRGARYSDSTPVPKRLCKSVQTVLSHTEHSVLLSPLMRHVTARWLRDLDERDDL